MVYILCRIYTFSVSADNLFILSSFDATERKRIFYIVQRIGSTENKILEIYFLDK